MTYATLRADIISFAQRSDAEFTAVVPTLVRLATSVLSRELRTPEMESRDTTILTSEYSGLPDDFLEMRAIKDSTGRELKYLAAQQFAGIVSSEVRLEVPIFTIEDFQLRMYPAPSVAAPLTVTILYYERLAPLVNNNDTNWLLVEYPDIYLYGSLLHARAWLHDEGRLAMVKQLHDEALMSLKRRKVHATGIASAMGSEVPMMPSTWDIRRG
jgi:hypothetical protein